jgi:hypothetical protein
VREGNLIFEDDLYSRDTRLMQAAAGAAAPSANAVRTVEALRRFTD